MMGGSHAITGAAGWLAVAGSAQLAGYSVGLELTPGLDAPAVLAGTVVAAGAAILPDIDHPSGTAARTAGPFSKAMASAVGSVAGHRGATHTLLAAFVFAAIASLVAALDWRTVVPVVGEVQIGAVIVVAVMTVFAVSAMKIVKGKIAPWISGATTALIVAVAAPDNAIWLPLAVGIGVVIHILGDALTTQGVPFPTWPLVAKPMIATPLWHKNGFVALPVLGNAGSAREWVLTSAVTLYVGFALLATITSML